MNSSRKYTLPDSYLFRVSCGPEYGDPSCSIKVWYTIEEIDPVVEFWVIKQIIELFFPWRMAGKSAVAQWSYEPSGAEHSHPLF